VLGREKGGGLRRRERGTGCRVEGGEGERERVAPREWEEHRF
jgi:hypothetical protein